MSLTVVLLVIAILFVSTCVRSTLGFGDALLAMPLLAMAVGIRTATPLVAFVASTIALAILLGNWRRVDLQATGHLILSTLLGIPVGLYFLKSAPEHAVKAILGGLLVLFGLYSLLAPRFFQIAAANSTRKNFPTAGQPMPLPGPGIARGMLAYLFGFVAGILGGAYNTNGPPIVIYGSLRRWAPDRFRATLQGYFFPTGLLILAGHGLSGLWTPQVFRLYACSLPGILLAIYLGGKLNGRIPAGRFERYVYLALVAFGVVLVLG